jgi:hypothetical protein
VPSDLNAQEWARLPPRQRVERCRLLAAEAQELSVTAPESMREAYLMIARNWLQLAREIEKSN